MKQMFTMINLLLIIATAFFCIKLFYQILIPNIDNIYLPMIFKQTKPVVRNESNYPLTFYNEIVERNLFKIKKDISKTPDSLETLEPTDLDLKLWGTISGDIQSTYAVIEEAGGSRRKKKQNLYRVGDEVQNAIVKKILREKVILRVNGRDETLEIEEFRSTIRKTKRSLRPVQQRRTIKRVQVENAVDNINKLMSQARIRPHSEGLYISHIKPGSIFRRLGLRNGDIITGVDGRRIKSIDDALSFYQNLRSASNVTLELKRRGRPRIINYTIR